MTMKIQTGEDTLLSVNYRGRINLLGDCQGRTINSNLKFIREGVLEVCFHLC